MSAAAKLDLFGRDAELAEIAWLMSHDTGPPASLVIEGEPGIGKTALWEAAVTLSAERRILVCRPTEAEAELSYSALGDLLEPIAEEALPLLPDPQADGLRAALLLATPRGSQPGARAVAAATLGVLRSAAAEEPVLLAIDDAQWIDPSSAAALSHALRRLRAERIAVLATLRTPHPDPLGLGPSGSARSSRRVTLGPLDVDALHATVRSHLGTSVPRPTMQRIHEVSGGKPLYAIELVRALPTRDGRVVSGSVELPPSLLALVEGRVLALDAATREALAAVAALASPTLDVLEDAVPDAYRALARAESEGIVEIDGSAVRFTHPLLASAALDVLGTLDRGRLHLRLARSTTDPEQIARHLALGTISPDEAVAAQLERAAEGCEARGASAAAAQLLDHAVRLTLSENLSGKSRRKQDAARNTFLAGDWGRARELYAELVAELPPGPERARTLIASFPTIEYATVGIEVARQAISEAGSDAICLADAHRFLAQALSYGGDNDAALAAARTAATLADELGDAALCIRCAGVLARFETYTGDVTPGALEAAVELEGASLLLASTHSPTQQLGERLLYGDRLAEGRVLLERCLRAASEQGDEPSSSINLLYLTQLEVRAGNWARADAYATELYELDAQLYGLVERTYFARALVDAHLGLVDETRALLALDEEESIGTPEPLRWEHVLNRWILGFLDLSLGDHRQAADRLRPLARTIDEWGYGNPGIRPVLPDTIEALVGAGEIAEARAWAMQLSEQGARLDNPWAQATAARSFALIAAAEGETDRALELLADALAHHERSENPFERGRTLLVLGETLRRARSKRRARDALTEALETFDTLGAALWAERTAAEIPRIGGRRPADGGLTPTEQRVADLAAEGKSNKEIASALFVTVRTVETHMRHVYEKLGVHSRAELAATISRREQAG